MTLRTKFRGNTKFFFTKKDFIRGNDCVESHTLSRTPCSGDYKFKKKCLQCGKYYWTDYKTTLICMVCQRDNKKNNIAFTATKKKENILKNKNKIKMMKQKMDGIK